MKQDWDFRGLGMRETQAGTHFFHHWTAKFIPQIPRRLIEQYAHPGAIVLDPFMGSGTTLVEAARMGYHAWGTDINPLAVRIARAKTARLDTLALDNFITWLRTAAKEPEHYAARSTQLFPGSEVWFRDDVARALRAILQHANSLDDDTRNFVEIGLSDLLKGMSNARMDQTIPTLPESARYQDKKHYFRWVDNETRELNPFARVAAQLHRMQRTLAEFHASGAGLAEPLLHDARELSALGKQAHLAITSPPYWNAQNYQKMHLLSFKLFGLPEPGPAEIGRRAKDYLPDMAAVTDQLTRVLHGHFALVIGESKAGIHEAVRDQCTSQGMKLIATYTRNVTNQAFFAKVVKQEFIYIFSCRE